MDRRPGREGDQGGTLQEQNWFRGPSAVFGGFEYQVSDRWKVMAEYSSDAYPQENGTAFNRNAPVNFAAQYQPRPGIGVSLMYLYGSEVGVNLTLALNPKSPPARGLRDKAPLPVLVRGEDIDPAPASAENLQRRLSDALMAEGLPCVDWTLGIKRLGSPIVAHHVPEPHRISGVRRGR